MAAAGLGGLGHLKEREENHQENVSVERVSIRPEMDDSVTYPLVVYCFYLLSRTRLSYQDHFPEQTITQHQGGRRRRLRPGEGARGLGVGRGPSARALGGQRPSPALPTLSDPHPGLGCPGQPRSCRAGSGREAPGTRKRPWGPGAALLGAPRPGARQPPTFQPLCPTSAPCPAPGQGSAALAPTAGPPRLLQTRLPFHSWGCR